MFGNDNPNDSPRNAIMGLIQQYKERKLTTGHVRKLNNIVICLMLLVAVTSIVWTVSIHIISGDFYNGFIGVKLAFRERDFTQMDNAEKDIFYHDLGRIINETYTQAALDDIRADALIMPKGKNEEKFSTIKPKVRKISHVFQVTNSKVPDTPAITNSEDDDDDDSNNSPLVPKVVFNIEKDRTFLAHSMLIRCFYRDQAHSIREIEFAWIGIKLTHRAARRLSKKKYCFIQLRVSIDIHQTRWHQNFAVQFIYGFPFLSEIVAIVWTAMCFIFQSGVKKHWGLPKPWRIVVPSIIMFTIMTVANLSYLILANGFIKSFCNELRENLSKPDAISCGEAMSVLRPVIRPHEFSHNVYMCLFKTSYILALVLWILALLIMVLRFLLAIDFQMVDIETSYDRELREGKLRDRDFVEVLLSSPQYQKKSQLAVKNERPRSEDDFQSAKSHVSEVATPLLDNAVTSIVNSANERST